MIILYCSVCRNPDEDGVGLGEDVEKSHLYSAADATKTDNVTKNSERWTVTKYISFSTVLETIFWLSVLYLSITIFGNYFW